MSLFANSHRCRPSLCLTVGGPEATIVMIVALHSWSDREDDVRVSYRSRGFATLNVMRAGVTGGET